MSRSRPRTSLLWGLVLLAIGLVLLLRALGQIPEGIYDMVVRAWPALLVLAGLSTLLRDRIPLGSGLALLLTTVLVAGAAALAYSTRSTQERTDNRQVIDQPVEGETALLEVSIEALAADVEIARALDERTAVTGEFTGSTESSVQVDYEASAGRAIFRLIEARPNPFPLLEAVGRGRLRLELPADLPIDLSFHSADGTATFNLAGLSLERLNITLDSGDATVTFPSYAPLSPTVAEQPGNLVVITGSITIVVPQNVSARLELNRGGSGLEPQFDAAIYNYLVGDVLEAKDYENAPIRLRYVVTVPRGRIRVEPGSP